jgi:hypothetical protein
MSSHKGRGNKNVVSPSKLSLSWIVIICTVFAVGTAPDNRRLW